jgi:penicillin-binding protein 1A
MAIPRFRWPAASPGAHGKKSQTRRRKTAKPNKKGRRPARRPLRWALFALLWGGVFAGLVALVYAAWASTYDLGRVAAIPERSAIYDWRGRFYSRLEGENRLVVGFGEIAPHFFDALLAREDTRFYRHHGVDPRGIARAMVRNLAGGGLREGGSTITQQLALNTFLGGRHDRSIHRKLLEAFLALRIEDNFTKRQILEHYANRIYFGSGVYGVETASHLYFDKPARDLSLGESAMLVGLIRSPNRFSPRKDLRLAIRERNTVLRRMASLGMIPPEKASAASSETPRIAKNRPAAAQQNYAIDAVRQELELILDDVHRDEGGLRIFTAIDPGMQSAGEAALEARLAAFESRPGYPHPKRVPGSPGGAEGSEHLQGALLAIDGRTGGIRAVVGGRSYAESRFNRAWEARRQIGSTFKPFVFTAAFEAGLSPGEKLSDDPLRKGEVRSAPDWRPSNSDGRSLGLCPAGDGLVFSRNLVSVRAGERAGLAAVRKLGAAAGFTDLPAHPSIYLGAFEASVKEVAAAYSIFPNGGIRRQAFLIERIEDSGGRTLYKTPKLATRATPEKSARQVHSLLADVLARGTGKEGGAPPGAAGKTGTTDGFRDAWFVGDAGGIACAVWAGFDSPRTIAPEGYGAAVALPVWSEFMRRSGIAGGAGTARSRPAQGDSEEEKKRKFLRSLLPW